jgi:hypothetical protein
MPDTDRGFIIDDPEGIELFHMKAQLSAMKLEAKGLKHSSGRSVTAHIKRVYKLKGNREKIIAQFTALIHDKEDERRRKNFTP